MSELEAAHQHIASLEQKLVKLKEYPCHIKQLQQEKHALRKSPERKIGKCCSRRIEYRKSYFMKSENPGLRRSAPRKTSMKRGLRGVA